jgi:putative membrane protein
MVASHMIEAPGKLDDDHLEKADKLSKLQGSEFDKEYMQMMVDNHQDTVDKLQRRADENRDGSVSPEGSDNTLEAAANQWAAESLPTVRQHLEMAKAIHDKLE